MKQNYVSSASKFEDISPLFYGEQECECGHTFGPYVRDHYIIHFCISGCGRLRDRYGEHSIGAGEMFIIRPGEVTTYSADVENPWVYRWISFIGKHADVFDCGYSVCATPDGIADKLNECLRADTLSPYICAAIIHELIYRLFGNDDRGGVKDRLHSIRKYIRYNYMEDIRVSSLARAFGFERSYLYRIFKERYGISVKEYIIRVRMENALAFLNEGYAVGETAHMVGYEDEFNFSKSFKKHFGKPPSSIGKDKA